MSWATSGKARVSAQRVCDERMYQRVPKVPSTASSTSAKAATKGLRSVMPVATGLRSCSKS